MRAKSGKELTRKTKFAGNWYTRDQNGGARRNMDDFWLMHVAVMSTADAK